MKQDTLAKVRTLRTLARVYRLDAPDAFWKADSRDLRDCYNGIGPDRWGRFFRSLATSVLRWYEADALIHDWEYTYAEKTYRRFTEANLRFIRNAWRMAWHQQGVCGARYALCGVLLGLLCQIGGWQGYKNAKSTQNEVKKL